MAKLSLSGDLWRAFQQLQPPDPERTAAREALILQHAFLVEKIARTLQWTFVHAALEDLVQDGIVGLVTAADRYQPRPGVRFEPFAYFRVRGAIIDAHKRRAYRDETHASLDAPISFEEGKPLVDSDKIAGSAPLADAIIERKQLELALANAVRSLPASDAALLQAWAEDAPIRDLCRISGMSPNSVRDRITQLIARVRAAMQGSETGNRAMLPTRDASERRAERRAA